MYGGTETMLWYYSSVSARTFLVSVSCSCHCRTCSSLWEGWLLATSCGPRRAKLVRHHYTCWRQQYSRNVHARQCRSGQRHISSHAVYGLIEMRYCRVVLPQPRKPLWV